MLTFFFIKTSDESPELLCWSCLVTELREAVQARMEPGGWSAPGLPCGWPSLGRTSVGAAGRTMWAVDVPGSILACRKRALSRQGQKPDAAKPRSDVRGFQLRLPGASEPAAQLWARHRRHGTLELFLRLGTPTVLLG